MRKFLLKFFAPRSHFFSLSFRPAVIVTCLLLLGLFLRLSLISLPGYSFDMTLEEMWGRTMAIFGYTEIYRPHPGVPAPNYPPLTILFYSFSARLHYWLIHAVSYEFLHWYPILIKLPAVILDLVSGGLLYLAVRKYRSAMVASLALAAYMAHPVIWYNSAVWGQTDGIFTLFSFAAVLALSSELFVLTGVCVALALLCKFQAIVFVPVIGLALLHRGVRSVLLSLMGFALTAAVFIYPFIVAGHSADVWRIYTTFVDMFPGLSLSAYNLWWVLFHAQANAIDSREVFLYGFTYKTIGLFLCATAFSVLLWKLHLVLRSYRSLEHRDTAIMATLCLCALSFFLLNVQIHERYSYPFVIFGIVLAAVQPRYIWHMVALSLAAYFNLLAVFPFTNVDRFFFRTFPGWSGVLANTFVVVTAVLFYQLSKGVLLPKPRRSRWREFLTEKLKIRILSLWPLSRSR